MTEITPICRIVQEANRSGLSAKRDQPIVWLHANHREKAMNNHSLPRRNLGAELQVSAIGLGCMGMSEFYGDSDRTQNLQVLNHALDLGVNFLDTADMYGVGRNEELLGEVLRNRRDEIVLATKFGNRRGPDGAFLGVCGTPKYVAESCDASLRRLGVDVIDLYYQHRIDPNVPIEETVGAMQRLVEAGKVRCLGLSEANGDSVRRAAGVAPIAALQSEYSLWTRDVENDALPTCRELGIAFVPYSPLGRGFLTGAIKRPNDLPANDWRRVNPRFEDGNFDANWALVDAIFPIAERLQITPAQLALAWLLHQGEDIVPIPGTRSVSRLAENARAASIELDHSVLSELRHRLDAIAIVGTRYPTAQMGSVNR